MLRGMRYLFEYTLCQAYPEVEKISCANVIITYIETGGFNLQSNFQVVYHPDALQTQMYQYKAFMDVSTPTAGDMQVPERFLLERETRS